MNVKEQIDYSIFPKTPGVYLINDKNDKIIYIGKAKNIQRRLRDYSNGSDTRTFVRFLDDKLKTIKTITTHTEKEALLLENELIKKYKPRFNIKLTDDKNYLCLRLDTNHIYPRLELVRNFSNDKALYFGPYHSAIFIRKTLRIINRYFQLRTCSDVVLTSRTRPCLQYQIKRCPAPCVLKLEKDEYKKNIDHVIHFLNGREKRVVQDLTIRMKKFSQVLEYEKAALIRDQIKAVKRSIEHQNIIHLKSNNYDVVGFYKQDKFMEIQVMRTRLGHFLDTQHFSFSNTELSTDDILTSFSTSYYLTRELVSKNLPDEIILPYKILWFGALGEAIYETHKKRIRITVPQKGKKYRLLELANRNAYQMFIRHNNKIDNVQNILHQLKKYLRLNNFPEIIECIDISHFQSSYIVGSCIRLESGKLKKSNYRHYKIQSIDKQNDYRAIYEIISRRIKRGIEESYLPNLIIIDGGKGQLGSAHAALTDHGIDTIDIIALAKSRRLFSKNKKETRSLERVFILNQKNPIILSQNSAELLILTKARDEAHRFALKYQRKLQRKKTIYSSLDKISGIGPKRRKKLLLRFGSIKNIQKASFQELESVLGKKTANNVYDNFSK